MSFKMGGNKSSGSSTQTLTKNVPDWLLGPAQTLTGKLTDLFGTDPQSLVPAADPLQTQAGATAANLGSASQSGMTDATQNLKNLIGVQTTGAPQISAASLLDNLTSYMSPYTKDVVDASMADFDASAGKTRAQQALDIANAGAFGGSGAALTKSATEDALARARASTDAGLRDSAFRTGAGLSSEDAGRRQAAAVTNADLKMQNRSQIANNINSLAALLAGGDANTRANVATQEAAGAVNRGIATDTATAPFNLQTWLEQMYQGLSPDMFTGQTIKGKTTGSNFGGSAGFTYGGGSGGGN